MKTLLRAAVSVFTLGISSAYAVDSHSATTLFPATRNEQAGAAPVVSAQNDGAAVHAYVVRSQSQGTWLFPPANFGN
jgi:hypothetical protein